MARESFQASHIELRHKTYYAVLYIPKDVRLVIGKTKFSRSTETGDQRIAERRAAAFALGWQAEISSARHESLDPLIAEAQDLLFNLKTSSSKEFVREIIEDRTNEISSNSTLGDIEADEFNKVATGRVQVLSSLIPAWIKHEMEVKGLQQKTLDQMERDVGLLLETLKTSVTLTPEWTTRWILWIAEDRGGVRDVV